MTKSQIIFNIITPIIIGVVASFSKSIFDRILATYNPDTKKLISYIKKSLIFIFRYMIPIIALILVFIFENFNKFFVINISILIFVIIMNIFLDVFSLFINKFELIITKILDIIEKYSK